MPSIFPAARSEMRRSASVSVTRCAACLAHSAYSGWSSLKRPPGQLCPAARKLAGDGCRSSRGGGTSQTLRRPPAIPPSATSGRRDMMPV